MAQAKLDLSGTSIPDKIQIMRKIVASMTGNANFAAPTPALTDVTAAIDTLETAAQEAQQARNAAKAKTGVQNGADEALSTLANALAGYVDAASEGDEEKILSSGMGVRSKASKPRELEAPVMAGSQVTQIAGELELRWTAVKGARTYLIERTSDALGAAGWSNGDSATRTKATVKNLTPGTRYSFRVAAVGPLGTGPWSEPIVRVA